MKFKPYFILSTMLIMLPANLVSQVTSFADKGEALFNKYVMQMAPYKTEPLEIILEKTAMFFLETPYVAHTLDRDENNEKLIVNLGELDCFTFVENVLALSLATHNDRLSESYFKEKLTDIRYRNGEITDYASRLHYTSDWLFENQQNNLLENISEQLSGEKETKIIDFMSSHRSAYKQLVKDDAMLNKIIEKEQGINERGGFFYLPKQLIAAKSNEIPHMSVIGFVTAIEGLDTTHVGFAFRKNGILTFIHASSAAMKVVIDNESLSDYCLSQKNCKGIIVAKVL
ncbi:MAG: N-acetylmuramoyl-L-alanine amidase-like domain-containing protein [Candidatus Saccharimonadaceae bacterium]